MQSVKSIVASMSPRWALVVVAAAVGIAFATMRTLESEDVKTRRAEMRKQKELRWLAQRIASYAQAVHQQFPRGDVVVSEQDLAERLRKRPELVVTALNLLLSDGKVQRVPLNGYWKLSV